MPKWRNPKNKLLPWCLSMHKQWKWYFSELMHLCHDLKTHMVKLLLWLHVSGIFYSQTFWWKRPQQINIPFPPKNDYKKEHQISKFFNEMVQVSYICGGYFSLQKERKCCIHAILLQLESYMDNKNVCVGGVKWTHCGQQQQMKCLITNNSMC